MTEKSYIETREEMGDIELNHDGLARARFRDWLGLDINLNPISGLEVRVIKGVPSMLYQGKVIHQALDIYAVETLIREYQILTEKQPSNRQWNALFKPYNGNFVSNSDRKPMAWYMERRPRKVLETLREKGINYYL